MTSGQSEVTLFIVITLNLEFKSTCRRKKHSLFHWNTLTCRATFSYLDVLQEQRIYDYWNVDVNRSLSDSWKGFSNFNLLKIKAPKGRMRSGVRLTKIQATTIPVNLWPGAWSKMGKSRSEEREARMEKPKLDNARRLRRHLFHRKGRWRIQKNIQNVWRMLEFQHARKEQRSTLASRNWSEEWWIQQDSKNKACVHCGSSWINKKAFGIISAERSWSSHRKQRIQFDDSLAFGAQVYSYAPSDENSGCESSSGQGMEEARDKSSLAVGPGKEQKRRYSGSSMRQKESPPCCTDGHLSSQKMRSWNQNFRSTKDESCSVTLLKTTLGPPQFLLNRARLRPRWLPQK